MHSFPLDFAFPSHEEWDVVGLNKIEFFSAIFLAASIACDGLHRPTERERAEAAVSQAHALFEALNDKTGEYVQS